MYGHSSQKRGKLRLFIFRTGSGKMPAPTCLRNPLLPVASASYSQLAQHPENHTGRSAGGIDTVNGRQYRLGRTPGPAPALSRLCGCPSQRRQAESTGIRRCGSLLRSTVGLAKVRGARPTFSCGDLPNSSSSSRISAASGRLAGFVTLPPGNFPTAPAIDLPFGPLGEGCDAAVAVDEGHGREREQPGREERSPPCYDR